MLALIGKESNIVLFSRSFETESCYVAQSGFNLEVILMSQAP